MAVSVGGALKGAASLAARVLGRRVPPHASGGGMSTEMEAEARRHPRFRNGTRAQRRNAWRRAGSIRDWRNAPYRAVDRETAREYPVFDKLTGLAVFDKKTKKRVTEWRPFVAIQVVHGSLAA